MSDDYLSKPLSFGSAAPSQNTSSQSSIATSQTAKSLSPYLNYDARFLQQTQPEYIFPEGASKQRGRFELAFSQIGSSVMIGAGIGGAAGFYNGMKSTTLANQTGKLRRTQLLNHVMKQGSATANTLGVFAVMYSGFGVLLQWARGEDDEINTVLAGTATGLLYKSSAGLKKCALGGAVGLGLSGIYCLFMLSQSDRNKYQLGSYA